MTQARWWYPALLGAAALFLIALFSTPIADTDLWWHLATGRYIAVHHKLPVPDPFAYTTAHAGAAYPGEETTRRFNLTHEWLSEVLMYAIYSVAGFSGLVLWRVALLLAICGVAAWIVWRRTGGFYRALAAAMACATLLAAAGFRTDRPYLISFLLLGITIAVLESGRRLWLLPVILLIWANCHGGFFLGWLAIGAYAITAQPPRRRLWIWGAAAVLISGLNPNGFLIVPVLISYRSSFLTSTLLEWSGTPVWPPQAYSILLAAGLAALLWARRRARPADWLLFIAFAAASLTAQRNIPLVAFFAPIVIASYWPWKRTWPGLAAAALIAFFLLTPLRAGILQFRPALWKYPAGAADFVLAHKLPGPVYNTYEWGGYLIWRLWPRYQVFIDGRALSENVFKDYASILYDHPDPGRPTPQQLLDKYGVNTVIMGGFEYTTGNLYKQAVHLGWTLVYHDETALVFTRGPASGDATASIETECAAHIERDPQLPRCARKLGEYFSQLHDFQRARQWVGIYLSHVPAGADPEAEEAFRRLAGF